MVGVAVKVTFVPEQIVVAVAETLTLGVTDVVTVAVTSNRLELSHPEIV